MSNEEKLEEAWSNGYTSAERAIALSLMHYLDEHLPENKMCLSNGECAQIEKAIHSKDWETITKYIKRYSA